MEVLVINDYTKYLLLVLCVINLILYFVCKTENQKKWIKSIKEVN